VLHHVSIEVHPEDAARVMEFFHLIGFTQVEAPTPIAEHVYWVERNGTQIHLIRTLEPAVQHLGHPAFVVPDFERTVAAVREAGFEFSEHRELWGERRGFATLPGGQKVELMAAAPPARRDL
jgi:hypothetical protein